MDIKLSRVHTRILSKKKKLLIAVMKFPTNAKPSSVIFTNFLCIFGKNKIPISSSLIACFHVVFNMVPSEEDLLILQEILNNDHCLKYGLADHIRKEKGILSLGGRQNERERARKT